MTRPTPRQIARGMWENRPVAPELLFWVSAVLICHWLIDIPTVALALIVTVILAGGSFYMALSELRKADDASTLPDEEGGHDAD